MPDAPQNALTAEVPLAPIDDGVVSGAPRMGAVEWGAVGGSEVGLWEITPGVVTDTEVDELFVVLRGSATVELLDRDGGAASGVPGATGDGGGPGEHTLTLTAGTVGRFAAGTRTRWTVTETLRKVYVIA